MYFPTSHIENHCKHSHVPNFPRTIFKCGKDIHCPKISDMFDYGGSALLDMCIVDCLMSLSVLAFLDSFLTLGLFGWRVVIINCVCPSVRLSVPIYLVNTITQSVYPINPPYFGLLQLSPGFYYNYNLPPLLMILIVGAFPGPDSCRVCHPQMAIFFSSWPQCGELSQYHQTPLFFDTSVMILTVSNSIVSGYRVTTNITFNAELVFLSLWWC